MGCCKLSLHAYQREQASHLQAHPRAALFAEMGLGKTAATLSALRAEHLPALVVAPLRVARYVWPYETRRWRRDLQPRLVVGSRAQRAKLLAEPPADLTIVTRDNLADLDPTEAGRQYQTLILDELSSFKTSGTRRSRQALTLSRVIKNVWGLTGTPTPNGVQDLYSQIRLLDGGERLGRTLGEFRQRYCRPDTRIPGVLRWVVADPDWALADITERIRDIVLSFRVEDHLDLPEMIFNTVDVVLPSSAVKVYDQLRSDFVAHLDDDHLVGVAGAAVLGNKLAQVAAGFAYHDRYDHLDREQTPLETDSKSGPYTFLHSAKIEALADIVETASSPVLVFYRYRAEQEMILKALPQARALSDESLSAWITGACPVLVAHPASAGHGLNLQDGGHTIVWTSLPWPGELWSQANARLHRQGQQNTVIVHILRAAEIDQITYRALQSKTRVEDALLEALRG